MNWPDLGKTIAPLAPLAGKIIGGLIPFPGAAVIGEQLGGIIARQFGVSATPQAINEAIAVAGEETARAKINAAVEQARVQIAGFVDLEKVLWHAVEVGLEQTGQTMRAEIRPENRHWFFTGWRPFIGWVFGISALCFGIMLTMVTGSTALHAADPLKTLNDAWPLYLSYFGVLGVVVGVVVKGRSDEKIKSMETGAPVNPIKPSSARK